MEICRLVARKTGLVLTLMVSLKGVLLKETNVLLAPCIPIRLEFDHLLILMKFIIKVKFLQLNCNYGLKLIHNVYDTVLKI